MALYNDPDFRRLPVELADFFETCASQSFFALSQWYDLMARHCVSPEAQIRVYTDDCASPAMAIVLCGASKGGLRCLSGLANFYSLEHGVIALPGADLESGLGAIAGEIQLERPRWHCSRFSEFDPRNADYGALASALRRAGFLVECTHGAATWFEMTAHMTFADYLAQRPSQLRSTWRRKRRSVVASGRLSAAFFPDSCGIEQAIADYEAVYRASWKPPEEFPNFIPALIRLAADLSALRLGVYYIDGAPAAAQFWIVWAGRATIYKLAHDRRFDSLSLGTLLTMEMIERVIELDRPSEINFGRGDDPYKRLWLPQRRQRWGITAANPRTFHGLRVGIEREAAKLYHRIRGEAISPPGWR